MEQGKSSGNIDEATFRKMTEAYERRNAADPTITRSVYFRKSDHPNLLDFLNNQECAGLDVIFGINDEGQLTVIMAGIDSKGNLMLDTLTDMAICCPPICGKP
jgi:hypothetical protein